MNKNKIKGSIFTALFIVCLTLIATLFRLVFDDSLKATLWWLATIFLITGLVSFIMSANKSTREKNHKRLMICKILFTTVGGVLFIVNSFVFISNFLVSILLVIVVSVFFAALALLPYCFADEKEQNAPKTYITDDVENNGGNSNAENQPDEDNT